MEDVVRRMNDGFKAWVAPKSLLSNRGLGINAERNVPTALYVYTLSGRTSSALVWHSEGRTFAAH